MSALVLPPTADLSVMSANIHATLRRIMLQGRVAAISGATVVVEGMSAPVGGRL